MKRLFTIFFALVVAVGMSAMASAQKGKGKPATTGLEHAEATANPHGERGIENAENKQAEHKDAKGKDKKKHKQHKKHHKSS